MKASIIHLKKPLSIDLLKVSIVLFCVGIFSLSPFSPSLLNAQTRYKITNPEVSFFAGTPLEDIDGKSDKLVGVIDAKSNEFAFRIAMNSFQFPRALMQEHYNENYLETEKFPNADFKGTIEGQVDWATEGLYEVMAVGTFDVHGVKKDYEIPAKITVGTDRVTLSAKFTIILEDHDIDRPKIVMMKIADRAAVDVVCRLELF
jgi:polyisoprenoid-binding protein YceI